MLLTAHILIALFIAWIWVDYFRLIDIFEQNKLTSVLLVFLTGAACTYLVYPLSWVFVDPFGFDLNGGFLNDLLYSVFAIGLIEEVTKMIPFILFYFFFKNQLREPIDYLAFAAVSALGFSATENVMYFQSSNFNINSRSILCSVSHMFDTCIFAYAFILYRFHPKYKNPLILLLGLLIASVAHGIYDFWLLYPGISFGWLITILFFFFCISIFATILNNALNNSSHFTYKKSIDIDRLWRRMLLYYGVVYIASFLIVAIQDSTEAAFGMLLFSFVFPGIIIAVCVIRLSRFRLIEGRWSPIKLELPFVIFGKSETIAEGFRPFGIRVKGASFNEVHLAKHYREFVWLTPLKGSKSALRGATLAIMTDKVFLKNDDIYFTTRVYPEGKLGPFHEILLKPKLNGVNRSRKGHPIVGYMEIVEIYDPANPSIPKKKYRFKEWVGVRSANQGGMDASTFESA